MKIKYGVVFFVCCVLLGAVAIFFPEIKSLVFKMLHRKPAQRVGLVLSGGCVRGAYEVGVWKALEELDVVRHIGAFSGTSIGSINAALFASGDDFKVFRSVWEDAVGEVFVLNDASGGDTIKHFFEVAMEDGFSKALEEGSAAIDGKGRHSGLCSTVELRKLLEGHLPRYWRSGPPDVYATAIERMSRRLKRFKLNGKDSSQYIPYMLASAAVPLIFTPVEIDGVEYLDGGIGIGGDNTPIDPIVKDHPEIDIIIVVYLHCLEKLDHRIDKTNYPGKKIIEIIPSRDISGLAGIGGSIGLSRDSVSSLIDLGYQDTMRVFQRNSYKER